jgi:hypothetical protein
MASQKLHALKCRLLKSTWIIFYRTCLIECLAAYMNYLVGFEIFHSDARNYHKVKVPKHPEEIRALSARSSQSPPPRDITHDLVEFLVLIGRHPIRVSVATVSFKLVRTCISIGWSFLFNMGIPQKFLALLSSGVPPPVYRSIQIIMLG